MNILGNICTILLFLFSEHNDMLTMLRRRNVKAQEKFCEWARNVKKGVLYFCDAIFTHSLFEIMSLWHV